MSELIKAGTGLRMIVTIEVHGSCIWALTITEVTHRLAPPALRRSGGQAAGRDVLLSESP